MIEKPTVEDIENEEGNEDIKIENPFNPSEINIKTVARNIGQLVELLEDNQILIPKYQRLPKDNEQYFGKT